MITTLYFILGNVEFMQSTDYFNSEKSSKILAKLAVPMVVTNLLQQLYNLTDSYIVSRYLGVNALAAVGVSFAILVFLNSFIIGLGLGSGVAMSQSRGALNRASYVDDIKHSLFLTLLVSAFLVLVSFVFLDGLLNLMRVEDTLFTSGKSYLEIMLFGMFFTAIYNYFSAILRSIGDTVTALYVLILSSICNIGLDLLFILKFKRGVSGAAEATIIAQALSAILLLLVVCVKVPEFRYIWQYKFIYKVNISCIKRILNLSVLTAVQQSIMNFGILLIQSLINSYGFEITAAFTAAVRIDAFAYMPAQDFSNAYGTYAAYLYGARRRDDFLKTKKQAFLISSIYCLFVTLVLIFTAELLVRSFLPTANDLIVSTAVQYLRIVSSFYFAIAWLFLWYAVYRSISDVKLSIVLTIISLGLRVFISYSLHSVFGLQTIFWAIPIGWLVADIFASIYFYLKYRRVKFGI